MAAFGENVLIKRLSFIRAFNRMSGLKKPSTNKSSSLLMKTKSTSQTPRKFKSAILLAITALAFCASPGSRADGDCYCETIWTHAGAGDWFTQSNWSSIVPDCGQGNCPGHPVEARINNGGTAQINSTTQTAYACEMFIGFSPGDSGSLSVSHGALNQCGDIFVGYGGSGKLTITNGGFVHTFFNPSIGSQQNSNGSVTVDGQYQDGTKSQWLVAGELEVGGTINGEGGTGLLTITNSATLTAGSVHVWKSGTVTGNSSITTTSGMTVDGTVAPSGGGGTLTINGALSFGSFGTMQCAVTPQDPSTTPQVSISGQVSLGGRLSVTMSGDFSSAPTRFTLLYANTFDVNHSKFDSESITYPTGQGCWIPQITYDYTGGHVHVYLDRVYNCN